MIERGAALRGGRQPRDDVFVRFYHGSHRWRRSGIHRSGIRRSSNAVGDVKFRTRRVRAIEIN